ncbi:MAG: hypothetical protein ACRDJL_03975 [Actinomycetota bacterium]
MSERSKWDLRTIVIAAVAAAVIGTALPAVGGLLEDRGLKENSGGQAVAANIGPGRSVKSAECDPTGTNYVSCGSVRLRLPRRGRVLLTMDGAWATSTAPSVGRCRFFGPGTSNEQVNFGEPTDSETDHHFGFNEVTRRVLKGRRTFGLQCREFTGDTIKFKEIMISAVYVGRR